MSAITKTTIYVGYPWDDKYDAKLMVEGILTECGISSYTLHQADGHWKGNSEAAMLIEVMGNSEETKFAISRAAHLLKHNIDRQQEAIWIVSESVDLVIL